MSRPDAIASDAGLTTPAGSAPRRFLRAALALSMGLASGALVGQALDGRAATALPAALVAAAMAMAGLALAWPFVRRGAASPRGASLTSGSPATAQAAPAGEGEEGPWLLHEGGTLHERLGHSLAFASRHPDHGLALLALVATPQAQATDPASADASPRALLARLRVALWPGDALAVGARCGPSREVLVLIDRPGGAAAVRHVAEQLLRACASLPEEASGSLAPTDLRAGAVGLERAGGGAAGMIRDARQALQQALADAAPVGLALRWFDAALDERRHREQEARDRLELEWAQAGPELLFEPVCRLADAAPEGICVQPRPPAAPWFDEDLAPALQPVVDARVMRLAVAQLARWRHALGPRAPAWVGTPVCGPWLLAADFPVACTGILGLHQLGPGDLRLLLPEADVADDPALGERVAQLRAQGLRVVLVGLGSRATSLSFLTQLPVEAVTLGPEVHGGWPARDSGRVRVAGIVGLAQSLGMTVVAAGLVDRAQCDALAGLGVSQGQGPALAPVMDVAEVSRWLAAPQETM